MPIIQPLLYVFTHFCTLGMLLILFADETKIRYLTLQRPVLLTYQSGLSHKISKAEPSLYPDIVWPKARDRVMIQLTFTPDQRGGWHWPRIGWLAVGSDVTGSPFIRPDSWIYMWLRVCACEWWIVSSQACSFRLCNTIPVYLLGLLNMGHYVSDSASDGVLFVKYFHSDCAEIYTLEKYLAHF